VEELISLLKDVVGAGNVSVEDFEKVCYSRGANADLPQEPLAIVRPRSKEDIVEIVRLANRFRVPIMVYGGGSNVVGAFSRGCIVLEQSGIPKKIEVDEESFTVTVSSNVTWTQLESELNRKGWMAAPLCNGGISATIGGGVALCNNGVRSARFGLIGDQVVGLEVILPTAEIIRTGSGAYPGAGNFVRYAWGPDLTGLFIGSHGLFGVITEVTLKIYELPEESMYLGYDFDDIHKLTRVMHGILRKRLSALEWMLAIAGGFPVTEETTFVLMMRLLGAKEEVEYARRVVEEISLKEGRVSGILPVVKNTRDLVEWSGPNTRIFGENMMLMPLCSCTPAPRFPKLAEVYGRVVGELNLDRYDIIPTLTAFGCDNVIVASPTLYYNQSKSFSWAKALEASRRIVEELADKVGFAPHYVGRTKTSYRPFQKLGAYYELVKRIKKLLDPNNIMNPGQLFIPAY